MSLLTEQLKNQHLEIINLLEECKSCSHDKEKVINKMRSAKTLLLAHLSKEDKELYPVLDKAAESNPELKNYLNVFASEMKTISSFVINFFDKNLETINPELLDDLAKVSFYLKNRIGKEERSRNIM